MNLTLMEADICSEENQEYLRLSLIKANIGRSYFIEEIKKAVKEYRFYLGGKRTFKGTADYISYANWCILSHLAQKNGCADMADFALIITNKVKLNNLPNTFALPYDALEQELRNYDVQYRDDNINSYNKLFSKDAMGNIYYNDGKKGVRWF